MQRIVTWKIPAGSLSYPLALAHRGANNLAPENTLSAFRKALDVGADGIEMDVRLTKDGEVVVIHDRLVNRTTNGKGPVGTHTLKELKALDAGFWYGPQFGGEQVPTLDEVFQALPNDTLIYVEMKVRGHGAWALVSRVIDVIRQHQRWESTMVASFNPIALIMLRMAEPRIIRGYIWSSNHPLPMRARWLSPLAQPRWYAPDRNSFTSELLAKLHSRENLVAAWDIDTSDNTNDLMELGLDAVVTDYADVLACRKLELTQ